MVCNKIGTSLITLLALFMLAGSAGAVPSEEWNKTFGGIGSDMAYSVWQTSDGGYILVGSKSLLYEQEISGIRYESGIWFIKTDSKGNEQWNKTIKLAGSIYGWENSVQQTRDGGYVLAGSANSLCGLGSSIGPGYCRSDAWLSKIDAKYNEQWNRTFSIIAEEMNQLNSVQQTSDGGYILAGGIGQAHLSKSIGWLIKTDASGNERWNRTFGGEVWNRFNSVQETMDGGYILAGYAYYVQGGVWLVKTDINGNEQWNRTFGPFGGMSNDWVSSVQQTSDGGYILASDIPLSSIPPHMATKINVWLIKTDINGNEQWNRTFGGSDDDKVYSVQLTSDSGYILAGEASSFGNRSQFLEKDGYIYIPSDSDAWLIKTDINGNEQWNKTFGGIGTDRAYSVRQTTDGGYILAGTTQSYGAHAWLIKVSRESLPHPEKAAGFEVVLAITILLAVYASGRKRR